MTEIDVTINRWMRPAAARTELGLSEASYYRLKKSGALKAAKINGLVFVDVGGFQETLTAQLQPHEA